VLRAKVEPFLCMGVIIATLKASGTLFCDIHKLKMWLSGLQKVKLYFFSKSEDILSRPGDVPFFNLEVAS